MAGGKETPRQKMIGMMYLVLTALLALQIKDAVLEQFVLIENGLETSNNFYKDNNERTVGFIAKAAQEQGNKAEDVKVAQVAAQVRSKTSDMIDYLDQLKQDVGLKAAKGDAEKIYKRSTLKKYEEPSRLLVEEKEAETLENKLNEFNQDVSSLLASVQVSKTWPSLALKAEDIPFYDNKPDEKKKTYAEFNFYKSPLASVLAQLTFYKNQIYGRESEALSLLGGEVGATSVKGFDLVSGTVLPVSNVVTAGTEFEADLFLTAANSALAPTMQARGQDLSVESGRGKIKFKAAAGDGEYDANGLAKKTFKAQITYNDAGEDKTIDIEHEYVVAKPTIRVGLNAVSALYLNCSNDLKIEVPSLGPAYQPSFNVTGGKARKGSKPGDVSIIPEQRNVKIGVSSSGIFIDNVSFKARRAPDPTLSLQIGGKAYDSKQSLDRAPAAVTLLMIPDSEFKNSYPKDARYFVTKGEVQLARGRQVVSVIPINSRTVTVELAKIRAQARKGDRIIVDIKEVTRFNFEDKPEVSTFNDTVVISIN